MLMVGAPRLIDEFLDPVQLARSERPPAWLHFHSITPIPILRSVFALSGSWRWDFRAGGVARSGAPQKPSLELCSVRARSDVLRPVSSPVGGHVDERQVRDCDPEPEGQPAPSGPLALVQLAHAHRGSV